MSSSKPPPRFHTVDAEKQLQALKDNLRIRRLSSRVNHSKARDSIGDDDTSSDREGPISLKVVLPNPNTLNVPAPNILLGQPQEDIDMGLPSLCPLFLQSGDTGHHSNEVEADTNILVNHAVTVQRPEATVLDETATTQGSIGANVTSGHLKADAMQVEPEELFSCNKCSDVLLPEPSGYQSNKNPVHPPEVTDNNSDPAIYNDMGRILHTLIKFGNKLDGVEKDIQILKLRSNGRNKNADNSNNQQNDSDQLPTRKRRPKDHVEHRPPQNVLLAEAARTVVMNLMKRKNNRDDLPPPPSSRQIRRHLEGVEGYGPSIEDFAVDYRGKPKSPWNAACGELFLDAFLRAGHGSITESATKIRKAFESHLLGLRKTYNRAKTYKKDPYACPEDLSKGARNRRQLTLYRRRLAVINAHTMLRPFATTFRELGPDGMSLDESDFEEQGKLYNRTIKPWRSRELSLFLTDLDTLHYRRRMTQMGRPGSGNKPHVSHTSTTISERQPVVGLPKNLYDAAWFSKLDDEEREYLEIESDVELPDVNEIVIRTGSLWKRKAK